MGFKCCFPINSQVAPIRILEKLSRGFQQSVGIDQAAATDTTPMKNDHMLKYCQILVTVHTQLRLPHVLFTPIGFGEILFLPALSLFQNSHLMTFFAQS